MGKVLKKFIRAALTKENWRGPLREFRGRGPKEVDGAPCVRNEQKIDG